MSGGTIIRDWVEHWIKSDPDILPMAKAIYYSERGTSISWESEGGDVPTSGTRTQYVNAAHKAKEAMRHQGEPWQSVAAGFALMGCLVLGLIGAFTALQINQNNTFALMEASRNAKDAERVTFFACGFLGGQKSILHHLKDGADDIVNVPPFCDAPTALAIEHGFSAATTQWELRR